MKDTFMSVDPGISGTGWSIFIDGNLENYGVISTPKGLNYDEKIKLMFTDFKLLYLGLHRIHRLDKLYIESPIATTHARSLAVFTTDSYLYLSMLIGTMLTLAWSTKVKVTMISPRKWKGQLPKKVVKQRLADKFNIFPRNHEADAIAIGYYVLGKF